MSEHQIREFVRWVIDPRGEDKRELMRELGAQGTFDAVMALFATALNARLGEAPTPETISSFVALAREKYVKQEQLPAALAEVVIRASFGEEELLAGVTDDELLTAAMGLSYAAVHDLGLSGDALDTFVDEVVDLLQEDDPDRHE